MKVKLVNKSHHDLPRYATPLSAGVDLRANLDAPVTLQPMEAKKSMRRTMASRRSETVVMAMPATSPRLWM